MKGKRRSEREKLAAKKQKEAKYGSKNTKTGKNKFLPCERFPVLFPRGLRGQSPPSILIFLHRKRVVRLKMDSLPLQWPLNCSYELVKEQLAEFYVQCPRYSFLWIFFWMKDSEIASSEFGSQFLFFKNFLFSLFPNSELLISEPFFNTDIGHKNLQVAH